MKLIDILKEVTSVSEMALSDEEKQKRADNKYGWVISIPGVEGEFGVAKKHREAGSDKAIKTHLWNNRNTASHYIRQNLDKINSKDDIQIVRGPELIPNDQAAQWIEDNTTMGRVDVQKKYTSKKTGRTISADELETMRAYFDKDKYLKGMLLKRTTNNKPKTTKGGPAIKVPDFYIKASEIKNFQYALRDLALKVSDVIEKKKKLDLEDEKVVNENKGLSAEEQDLLKIDPAALRDFARELKLHIDSNDSFQRGSDNYLGLYLNPVKKRRGRGGRPGQDDIDLPTYKIRKSDIKVVELPDAEANKDLEYSRTGTPFKRGTVSNIGNTKTEPERGLSRPVSILDREKSIKQLTSMDKLNVSDPAFKLKSDPAWNRGSDATRGSKVKRGGKVDDNDYEDLANQASAIPDEDEINELLREYRMFIKEAVGDEESEDTRDAGELDLNKSLGADNEQLYIKADVFDTYANYYPELENPNQTIVSKDATTIGAEFIGGDKNTEKYYKILDKDRFEVVDDAELEDIPTIEDPTPSYTDKSPEDIEAGTSKVPNPIFTKPIMPPSDDTSVDDSTFKQRFGTNVKIREPRDPKVPLDKLNRGAVQMARNKKK